MAVRGMRVVQVGSWRWWWGCDSVGVKQWSLDTVSFVSSKCTAPAAPLPADHQGLILTRWLLLQHPCTHAKSLQSCLTLCDPMNHSSPGSSVHGILQARILEWLTVPSSRGSSWSRDWTHVSYISCIERPVLYHWSHLGSPLWASKQDLIPLI